jgi:hypothetical protein
MLSGTHAALDIDLLPWLQLRQQDVAVYGTGWVASETLRLRANGNPLELRGVHLQHTLNERRASCSIDWREKVS